MGGHARGRVGHADDRYAVVVHDLADFGQLTVAALVRRHVDHDGAFGHALDHRGGNQHGRLAPRHGRGGDDDVGAADLGGQGRALALQFFGRELAGVPAGSLGRHAEVEKRRAQALRLLLGGGPHVVGLDHRAQTPRRRDGLQTGHPDAHHEHLGRRHGPGRRHEHGEELGQMLCCAEPGPVARDGALRAQGVHALGPADPGQQVEAEHCRLLGGEGTQRILRLGHPEEAERGHALGQRRHLFDAGRVDLDDQTRPGHAARAVGCRGPAGFGVGRVLEGRLVSSTRLDPDHPARADKLLDHVRDEGHAALSGTGLRGDRQ